MENLNQSPFREFLSAPFSFLSELKNHLPTNSILTNSNLHEVANLGQLHHLPQIDPGALQRASPSWHIFSPDVFVVSDHTWRKKFDNRLSPRFPRFSRRRKITDIRTEWCCDGWFFSLEMHFVAHEDGGECLKRSMYVWSCWECHDSIIWGVERGGEYLKKRVVVKKSAGEELVVH